MLCSRPSNRYIRPEGLVRSRPMLNRTRRRGRCRGSVDGTVGEFSGLSRRHHPFPDRFDRTLRQPSQTFSCPPVTSKTRPVTSLGVATASTRAAKCSGPSDPSPPAPQPHRRCLQSFESGHPAPPRSRNAISTPFRRLLNRQRRSRPWPWRSCPDRSARQVARRGVDDTSIDRSTACLLAPELDCVSGAGP